MIAFERYRIIDGVEKPDSPEQIRIRSQIEPTVWNHLEAAMAYANDLPMLVLVERGVHRQGMLSKRFEWNATEIDTDPQLVKQDAFRQVVDDWLGRVESSKTDRERARRDLEEVTIGEYLASMKPQELWATIGAVFTVLAAVAGAAYWAGSGRAQVTSGAGRPGHVGRGSSRMGIRGDRGLSVRPGASAGHREMVRCRPIGVRGDGMRPSPWPGSASRAPGAAGRASRCRNRAARRRRVARGEGSI